MSNKEYYWLNSHSRLFLERGYLEADTTPEQRIRQIAENAEKILKKKGFADKFEEYMKRGFYSLATPVWCNFGNKRGLPVSCFGSHIEDKMEAILTKSAEVGMMSKMGGGTSGFLVLFALAVQKLALAEKVVALFILWKFSIRFPKLSAREAPEEVRSLLICRLNMLILKNSFKSEAKVTLLRT